MIMSDYSIWKLGMVRSALIGKRFNEPISEDVTTDEYEVRFLTSYKRKSVIPKQYWKNMANPGTEPKQYTQVNLPLPYWKLERLLMDLVRPGKLVERFDSSPSYNETNNI